MGAPARLAHILVKRMLKTVAYFGDQPTCLLISAGGMGAGCLGGLFWLARAGAGQP